MIKRTFKRSAIRVRSHKQAQKERINAKHKETLLQDPICCVCKGWGGHDLMHLLNKNVYSQHYTNPDNLRLAHRDCHRKYDDDLSFRRKQTHLYNDICKFDILSAQQYFRVAYMTEEERDVFIKGILKQ